MFKCSTTLFSPSLSISTITKCEVVPRISPKKHTKCLIVMKWYAKFSWDILGFSLGQEHWWQTIEITVSHKYGMQRERDTDNFDGILGHLEYSHCKYCNEWRKLVLHISSESFLLDSDVWVCVHVCVFVVFVSFKIAKHPTKVTSIQCYRIA